MAAEITAPSFLSAFGPSVDGVVIKVNFQQELLLNILPELQGYSAGSIALGKCRNDLIRVQPVLYSNLVCIRYLVVLCYLYI